MGTIGERPSSTWFTTLGGIPPRNPDFVGRRDLLAAVTGHLAEGRTVLLPHRQQALGGVGKTQVAVEYVHRHLHEYDLVWWLPAEQPAPLRASLVALAQAVGLPESGDVEHTLAAVRETLSHGRPELRWLLVFDNANRPEDVLPYLPEPAGHVLITSRHPRWATLARAVEVDAFRRTESVELLQRRGHGLSPAEAHRIAERLHDGPLALDQAAALQANLRLSADEYLERYDKHRAELAVAAGGPEVSPIAVTWSLALEGLAAESAPAIELLKVCAFLAGEPLSAELIAAGRGQPFTGPLVDATRTPDKARAAIRLIGKFGLAQTAASGDWMQLHRLVQVLLLTRLSLTEGGGYEEYEERAYRMLAAADPGAPDDPLVWPMYGEITPHLVISGALTTSDRGDGHAYLRRSILHHIRYLYARGDYLSSIDLGGEAVRRWGRRPGADHPDTLVAGYHLANALRASGRTGAAREMNEGTLARQRAVLGDDHVDTLVTANSVGADLRILGRFRAAYDLDLDTLGRHQATFGPDDPRTLRSANNLAVDLRLLGEYAEAAAIDQETLRRRRVVFDGPHPETLSSLSSLARDRYGLGEFYQAMTLLEEEVGQHRRVLGDDHPMVLLSTRHYAMALRRCGSYEEARNLASDVVARYTRKLGPNNVDTLAAVLTLANCAVAEEDVSAARALIEDIRGRYREVLSADHPFTLGAEAATAMVLRLGGAPGEARLIDEEALAGLRGSVGPDHPFTLSAANGLVLDLVQASEVDAAAELMADTVTRSAATRPTHPDTSFYRHNYGLVLTAAGRPEDGAAQREQALNQMSLVGGDDGPDILAAAGQSYLETELELPPL